jgi:integrase/recombinase XerD
VETVLRRVCGTHFVVSTWPQMRLSTPAREIVTIIRRHKLTYNTLSKAVHAARTHLSLRPPSTTGRRLPKLLTAPQIASFYTAIDSTDNLQHQIMLRLLFYTALRVSELCSIKLEDVDLTGGRIYIRQGKGDKDRYVVFPDKFRVALRSYMAWQQERNYSGEYLFSSRQRDKISERRVQKIVGEYAVAAGLTGVHPHLFRHQMLTHLTKSGMSDSEIQLISGHASKATLEKYQHLALSDVKPSYEKAMNTLDV